MDIVAHALWAGAGVVWARRRWRLPAPTAAAVVTAAVLPDLVQGLPVAAWALLGGGGGLETLWAFALAVPGQEPTLPAAVHLWSHHLHCAWHSAVVLGAVSLLSLVWRRATPAPIWPPLWGWWAHVVIDVFTHSKSFYPVPVFYPFTYEGFDGIAWNTPWFQWLNYGSLAAVAVALWLTRRRAPGPA
jgi:hypothetical protein